MAPWNVRGGLMQGVTTVTSSPTSRRPLIRLLNLIFMPAARAQRSKRQPGTITPCHAGVGLCGAGKRRVQVFRTVKAQRSADSRANDQWRHSTPTQVS